MLLMGRRALRFNCPLYRAAGLLPTSAPRSQLSSSSGIEVGRITRQVKQFDALGVLRQPTLHGPGMMDLQVVEDQKDFAIHCEKRAAEESRQGTGVHGVSIEHEADTDQQNQSVREVAMQEIPCVLRSCLVLTTVLVLTQPSGRLRDDIFRLCPQSRCMASARAHGRARS